MNVYELRDTTNDDMYFWVGTFSTLRRAVNYIDETIKRKLSLSEFSEEHEIIAVYEIPVDQPGQPVLVVQVERDSVYDEENDTYELEVKDFWRRDDPDLHTNVPERAADNL